MIPHEDKVRRALRQLNITQSDVDDLIQDAYCRLAKLTSVDHIDQPGAYFMQIVKNAWRDSLKRARVVSLEDFSDTSSLLVEDDSSNMEASLLAREKLKHVRAILATLPERCQMIFTWRRIEGMSQREIARRLGVSENIVENDIQKALRLIQRELREPQQDKREQWKLHEQRQKIG